MEIANLVAAMAELTPKDWRSLSAKMAWCYRLGDPHFPPQVTDHLDAVPTREEWRHIRRRIMSRRIELAKTRRMGFADKKRAYMREYMRTRREQARNEP